MESKEASYGVNGREESRVKSYQPRLGTALHHESKGSTLSCTREAYQGAQVELCRIGLQGMRLSNIKIPPR